MTPEQIVCEDIEDVLDSLPNCAYRKVYVGRIAGGRKNPAKGLLDYVVTVNGRSVFIEAKSEKGRVRPSQEEFMRDFLGAGALCIVARDGLDVFHALEAAEII